MTRPGLALVLVMLTWAVPGRADERPRIERTKPFLVATAPAELSDDTRPVARDVARAADGSATVTARRVEVPEHARLEAWVGVAGSPAGAWRFTLRARGASREVERVLLVDPGSADGDGWHRLVLNVGPVSSQVVSVEISAEAATDGASGLPLLGAPRFVVSRPPEKAARNVIVVSLDTLRADRLSVYGAERPTSPKMDAIAAEGVRFETALAPASSTPPSHMTMLTGTIPCRHGVWGVHLEDTMSDEIDTLAEIFAREGYTTAAITENAYMSPPYGFARGFDSYVELKQMVADRNSPSPGVITPTGYGPKTFAAADRWLREHAGERFFLFLHTYQVHGPRRPNGRYAALFAEPAPTPDRAPDFDPAFHDLRRYDQLVRQLDDLVGGLVRQVSELGLADETLLVLTSDHGEAFFEHGDHGHGWSVHGEVLRVPFIVWAPGLASPGVVEDPVGLVDLVPTVLALVALPVPDALDGTSQAARVRSPSKAAGAVRTYYAETAPGNVRSARTGRFKIIRGEDASTDVLFDLRADPAEKSPIALGAGGVPERLRAETAEVAVLRAELDRRASQCATQRRQAAERRGAAAELDPTRHEKLKALGYVE